jgi:hypothetical protein
MTVVQVASDDEVLGRAEVDRRRIDKPIHKKRQHGRTGAA